MGKVTESIFAGESAIIPLAEVHHIEIDKRVGFDDGISVILNGTTWNQEIDTYNNSPYLSGREAVAFRAGWRRYRAQLESETLLNIEPLEPEEYEIFKGTKKDLGKLGI